MTGKPGHESYSRQKTVGNLFADRAPRPGQMVLVRNRPAVVRDLFAHSTGADDVIHVVQVEYIDGWFHPSADQLIWEREVGAKVLSGRAFPRIEESPPSPDDPESLHAFLDAYRWSAVNDLSQRRPKTPEDIRFIAPWHSAIQVEDYQLYPLLKALLMPRVSLLLADDVGLGKTIEAGLVLSELFARRRIRRVLIICPASLQRQWRGEMREKFHLDFEIVDRDETFRMRRSLGMDSNPWATYPRIVTSMDYLRQRDVLSSFLAATKGISTSDGSILPWQMLIVDEAHNFFPSMFGDDSDRYRMLKEISPRFEHRLFLTATPHNGYTVSFTGLLELLDPVRFRQTALMEQKDREQVRLVMVRRLKSELNDQGKSDRFANREVQGISIAIEGAEKDLFVALRNYRDAALTLLAGMEPHEKHIGQFLLTLLTKRLLSSSYAFACTWWEHVEGIQLEQGEADVVNHAIERARTPVNDDEEKDLREMDVARQAGSWLFQYASQLRDNMDVVGEKLTSLGWSPERIKGKCPVDDRPPSDARWDKLISWIEAHLKQDGGVREDERLIIFTEYKHTLDYLLWRFHLAGYKSPQLEHLFGGSPPNWRENVKEMFNDPASPLRILLATDVASEGINLQTNCRYVFHQDIPWNPMRLDQRNGRVDRHGQARDVYVYHFTSDHEADLRFMAHIVKKVEQARDDLGSVGQVIDQAILEHFTQGKIDDKTLDQRIENVKKDDVEGPDTRARDRGAEVCYAQSLQRLRATELALGLSQERLAQLLSRAMRMEGGKLEATSDANIYRIRVVPPTWKKLVRETINIRLGPQQGALPKLVFDPSHFETVQNGRKIYRTRSDTALIRLGHPIMRRAIGVLKRRLWDGDGLSRWTVEAALLPAGIEEVLVLHLMLEVSNTLREVVHQEIIITPFQVRGDALTPVVDKLWHQLEHVNRHRLSQSSLASWTERILNQWISHEPQLDGFIKKLEQHKRREIEQRMAQRLKQEIGEEKERFNLQLKELDNEQKRRGKQQAELERQRRRMQQPSLLPEIQVLEEQKLRNLEWEAMNSHFERMKRMLEKERGRMLEVVLPRRFELASLDLQPLAVEYLVSHEGREG